ncbi:MAG: hypothetical protein IJS08_10290 [Victivallales bacterium]|nr:hypothetical protein [Victivallales bacterium]
MRISKGYDGTVHNYMGEQIPSHYGDFLEPGQEGEISNLYPVQTYNEISSSYGGGAGGSGGYTSSWMSWLCVWGIIIVDYLYCLITTGNSEAALVALVGHIWFLIKGLFILNAVALGLFVGAIAYICQLFFG